MTTHENRITEYHAMHNDVPKPRKPWCQRWAKYPIYGIVGLTLLMATINCGTADEQIDATPALVESTQSVAPSEMPTATPTPEPMPTPTPEPTVTPEPTATPEPTPTPEPTATPEPTPTPEPTATPEPTPTPEPTATPEPASQWTAAKFAGCKMDDDGEVIHCVAAPPYPAADGVVCAFTVDRRNFDSGIPDIHLGKCWIDDMDLDNAPDNNAFCAIGVCRFEVPEQFISPMHQVSMSCLLDLPPLLFSGHDEMTTARCGTTKSDNRIQTPVPQPAAVPNPVGPAGSQFRNCTELREVYPNGVSSTHPAYQAKFDRDNDGFACETN